MIRQVTFKFYDIEESHIKCPGYLWTFHLNKVQDCHQKLKTISFTCIQISSWHAHLNYLLKTFWISSWTVLADSERNALSLSLSLLNPSISSWSRAESLPKWNIYQLGECHNLARLQLPMIYTQLLWILFFNASI